MAAHNPASERSPLLKHKDSGSEVSVRVVGYSVSESEGSGQSEEVVNGAGNAEGGGDGGESAQELKPKVSMAAIVRTPSL